MSQSAAVEKANAIATGYRSIFGTRADVFRAPGRVNLIGEHTDYNDGFVMPAAIDFSTWVAIGRRDDRKLAVHSTNFSESVEFDLDDSSPRPQGHWSDYVRGVAMMLRREGALPGANLYIRGEVPLGSGLSSSASIEVATALALAEVAGLSIDRVKLALLCQRAENEFVGARCGIMDQFISACGHEGKALMLDCRSLAYQLLPIPADVALVICNTMVKHELSAGEYNVRRRECEEGVRRLAKSLPGVRALRDVTIAQLEEHGRDLPPVVYRRCRHVIGENERVQQAATALVAKDLGTFGTLMAESHRSLRDDYEVSCEELDVMVELAAAEDGVWGARMTGGGFGGCTINLLKAAQAERFQRNVAHRYEQRTGRSPEIYVCNAAEGAEQVPC